MLRCHPCIECATLNIATHALHVTITTGPTSSRTAGSVRHALGIMSTSAEARSCGKGRPSTSACRLPAAAHWWKVDSTASF
eukprot:4274804-Pyramimonas_sp.AAC.1